jgi:hypothetical protein
MGELYVKHIFVCVSKGGIYVVIYFIITSVGYFKQSKSREEFVFDAITELDRAPQKQGQVGVGSLA